MDITQHVFDAAELSHLLPELVLAAAAFGLLMFDLFFDSKQKGITHWLAMAVLIVVGAMAISGVGGQPAHGGAVLNGMFVRDGLADLAKGVICFVAAAGFVYALPYLKERGIYKGEVPVLMLFATLGMMVLASSNNLVMVYVGLEMLALCSYALVAVDRDSPLATEAGMKYFVLGALASGMLLYGMSLVYGAAGTLDLPAIHVVAASGENAQLLLAGMVFIVAGLAFKLGAAPFHMWLPDVYQGAPTPITQFIGAAPKLAAFVMTYRLLESGLGPVDDKWRVLIGGLAALSLIVGNLMALMQTNLKRMLAYSTISHVGFLLMGLAGGGQAGYGAALFYAVIYTFTTVAAFGAIVLLSRKGFEAEEISDYKGLAKRNPWMALLILCIMASLAGVPPFIGFFAKVDVITAAVQGDMLWLAIIGIVFAVIGAFYYLRVIKAMYFDAADDSIQIAPRADRAMSTLFAVNALLLLGLAFSLNPILAWCHAVFAVA
ncbi:MAG: NADH-quinone oxidoreductase subunit NuoN [Pseudomonadota bacterium]|nr:NADH-quinone oxidoreductase subunit NuoN [Pseudomonadota bacterium]